MALQRVSVPKGMRDFSPSEMAKRDFIFSTIRSVFSLYGYQPLETPAMEHLSTLLGKYGDEGDKLLFRVLNSGDFLKGVSPEEVNSENRDALARAICDRGLRYDLTVPFARYVSQRWNELPRPFKRFQIQPVWRADRPQKGRYREFYQCDIDVVGSDSMLCEMELVQVVEEVFRRLGVRVELRFNNRKILAALAELLGHPELLVPMTVAIDKLEKVGIDGVREELRGAGFSAESVERLAGIVAIGGENEERIAQLRQHLTHNELGQKGVAEAEQLLSYVREAGVGIPVILDLSLARGLNYYTGTIFEVKSLDVPIGSVCGGGRYDDLTGIFGLKGVSGVGISFGADRIYDVMQELELFPANIETSADVLVLNMGESAQSIAFRLATHLRNFGIRTLLYPDAAKMKRQMDYANKQQIPWVLILGESELQSSSVSVRNMTTGEQTQQPISNCAQWLKDEIGKKTI